MEPALHAYLSYRDAPAGIDWLEKVGFNLLVRQDRPDGTLLHAEVRLGTVVLSAASADAEYETPSLVGDSIGGGLYLWFPEPSEVDAWYSRAVDAGARGLIPPHDTEWGTRRARVLDPECHEWSVGTYRPGSKW